MIPLCEPAILGRELEYVSDCVTTGWISSAGEYVVRFEKALAEYVGVKHAVACNSGTSALHISLVLCGVKPDDEVIVPTVTFIATVNPVRYVGAWPVFVDCDEYCNIDVAAVRRFLADECVVRDGATFNRTTGRRVSAIMPGARLRHLGRHGRHQRLGRRVPSAGGRRCHRVARLDLQGPHVRQPRARSPA